MSRRERVYRIAVIPGDGVGKEVIAAGCAVLESVSRRFEFSFEFTEFPWGCEYYLEQGAMLPPDGLQQLAFADAVYLGAVGYPTVPDHISLRGLLIPIRTHFALGVNLRPIRLLHGINALIPGSGPIDFVIVRENIEGEYAGLGGRHYADTSQAMAIQTSLFTRQGTRQAMIFAFELARKRKGKLDVITKSNALQHSMVFWDDQARELQKDYPDVQVRFLHVDAAAARLVQRPDDFDVIVASNLFGDILSELGAALIGGLGVAPSANLNSEGRRPALFEPVHGSAPDIVQQGIANPVAAIWSAAMMLDWLGEVAAGEAVTKSIEYTLLSGIKTADLGGNAKMTDVAGSIQNHLRAA